MNIIFVVADDLGWGDVGYHNPEVSTPHIDQMAISGTRLENFYVQGSCSPTRAAFMTGMFPFRLGMQRVLWPWNTHGLPEDIKLLPQRMKDAGFATAMFGKWNLGHGKLSHLPTRRGFEYHYGSYTGCMDSYKHDYYNTHDLNENETPVYDEGHISDLLTDKIVEKIGSRDKGKPFFYYLAYNAPHVPIASPPYFGWTYRHMKDRNRASYLSMVTHLDYCLGRLLNALSKEKILDDTLIWFSTDNGGWLPSGSSNGPLAGGKANNTHLGIAEGSIKAVNFVYYHPWNKGCVNNSLLHAVDVLPTLCFLAGHPVEGILDGINLLENNQSRSGKPIIHNFIGDNIKSFYGACRKDQFKYICKDESCELYDLYSDPFEENNLAESHPAMKLEMRKYLEDCLPAYIPDPATWVAPNGYPDGYVSPKEWHINDSVFQKQSISRFIDEVDLHKVSPIEILGYHNLLIG